MKKFLFLILSLIFFYFSINLFRLSIPIFEIRQMITKKQTLINSGVDFNSGGVFILKVYTNSPASQNGIEKNSQITLINGESINDSNNFLNTIKKNLGKLVTLTVCKLNICNDIEIIPRENPPSSQGPLGIEMLSVSIYNKNIAQIIYEQIYDKYIGGDLYSILFGRQTLILSWINLVLGIVSLIVSIKLISKIFSK